MTTSYVPVPFPTWSCRTGTRMKSGIPLVRGAGLGARCKVKGAGQIPANDRRTRGGVLDSTTTLVESEGSVGYSWTETPVTLNLIGYEILEKRSKFTVSF